MKYIVIGVETKKQAKIDSAYIDKLLKAYYVIDNNVRLEYVYFNGKGAYESLKNSRTLEMIKNTAKSKECYLVCCVDTDKSDVSPEIRKLNLEIDAFCKKNHYPLVWFCRNIEEVLWQRNISDSAKKKQVGSFNINDKNKNTIKNSLIFSDPKRKQSNFLLVFDKILKRKPILVKSRK